MPRSIPTNSLSAMMAADTSEAWLVLLTITHSTGTVRITSDAVDTSFGGNTYTPLPFDIILPTNETGKVPQATLVLDNVDRQLIYELRTQSTPMTVQIDVVASSDVAGGNATATYTDFVLRSIDYTSTSISGRLTLEDFLAEPYPKDIFSQSLFPGLFGFGTDSEYEPPLVGEDATNFSEYTVLAALDDWTKESGTSGATLTSKELNPWYYSNPTGNRMGDFYNNAHAGTQAHTWDKIGVGDDIEIYTKIFRPETPTWVGVIFRVDDHGSGLEGYFFGMSSGHLPVLGHIEPGNWGTYDGPTVIDSSASTLTARDNDPIFIRVRMVGSTIQARMWVGSESEEPTAWTYNVTDTAIPAAGRVGIYHSENYNGNFHIYCDYFICKNPYSYAYPSEADAPVAGYALTDDFSNPLYVPGSQPYLWVEAPETTYGSITMANTSATGGTDPDYAVGTLDVATGLQVTVGGVRTDAVMHHDMEILALIYIEFYGSETRTNGVMVRYNPNIGNYYRATIDSTGNGRLWVNSTQLGSTLPLGFAEGPTYFRLRVEGTALTAKFWTGTLAAEPSSWMMTAYDSTYTQGHCGVINSSTSTANRHIWVQNVAMAYGGGTASF